MRRVLVATAISMGMLAAFVWPAVAAAGTLDQSQTSGGGAYTSFGGTRLLAQTFTDGLTGNLDQADVYIHRNGSSCTTVADVVVEIRTLTGGTPSDTALATASIPAGSVATAFGWLSAAFAAPAAVTAGTQYALVLSSPGSSCSGVGPYDWGTATTNPYAGGGALIRDSNGIPNWTVNGANNDYMFKTYVGPPTAAGTSAATGERAAALASCKKRAHKHHWSHKRLRKCKRKANLLPL